MSTGPANLADLAEDVLAALVAQYEYDDATLLPARRYVTHGTPVADCESLVVAFEALGDGTAAGERLGRPASLASTNVATLVAWAFRCLDAVVEGEGEEARIMPDPDVLTADARRVMTDAYVLRRGAIRARLAGVVRDAGLGIQVGRVEPIEPSGGIGGVRLTLLVDVF